MEERGLALRLALVVVVFECFVDEFKLVVFVDFVALPRSLGEVIRSSREIRVFFKDANLQNFAFRRQKPPPKFKK